MTPSLPQMMPSFRSVKRAALRLLESAGFERAIANSRWRRHRLLILAYHGISEDDEHEWNGALYMSSAIFEERLRALRAAQCTVLPLDEAISRLYAGTLPARSVAVTFDDGYHNFVSRAYPLLAAHGIPTTVYLRTSHVGCSTPVFRLVCSYLLWKANRSRITVPELRPEPFQVGSALARRATVEAIVGIARRDRLTPRDDDSLARILAHRVGFDYGRIVEKRLFQMMAPPDVSRLAAAGVDFQLHTHTHSTPREQRRFFNEIETNRARIREMTRITATHFCYPSGNYDPVFLPWLRELGVRSATTCDPGLVSPTTPSLLLSRFVDTSVTSSREFQGWLSGASAMFTLKKSYADKLP